MQDCLFCKIISGTVPVDIILENENIIAFNDIEPQAPVHILIIPKKHIISLNEITIDDKKICGDILLAAKEVSKISNINDSGYRTVFNTNEDAGQTVFHIHLHLIGGRKLKWPPG